MNFNKVYFSSILLSLFWVTLLSQELPPIKNFSVDEYQGGNQNWMISQDSNNCIYIANNLGLLEFNGAYWKLYDSPNGTVIRSVKVINDIIYSGCYMEFGYWQRDEYGTLNYKSLSDELETPLIVDENFWNILQFNNWVLFQSLDRIYLYNTIENSFNIIESKRITKIFNVGEDIYFQKINEGIFLIEKGDPVSLSNSSIFKQNLLVGAFSVNGKILFLNEKGEFYFLKDREYIRWNIEANNDLLLKKVYSSIQLKDGSFVLGTISNGIIQLDKNGNFLRKINKEKGLYNNTILSIFEDRDENLWLGLDNGISRLNLSSPFKVFSDLKGGLGDVYTAKVFENHLYIGTNQGLFYKQLNSVNDFKLIEHTNGQVWCLKVIDNTLFCGHNNGTYTIEKNKAKHISNLQGTWDIKKIEKNQNLLLQGNYHGLSVLEKINNEWTFRNSINGFDLSSKYFEFVTSNKIIVNHENSGTHLLDIDDDFHKVIHQKSQGAYGYGSSFVNYKNNILYTANSNRTVYKYDVENEKFIVDPYLTSTFYEKNNNIVGTLLVEPVTSTIWGFSDKNIINVSNEKLYDTSRKLKIPVSRSFRRSLGVPGFENLTYLDENLFLIGSSNGYLTIDLAKIKPLKYSIIINSIHTEFRNAPVEKISLIEPPKLEFDKNNLKFYFSVPEFNNYSEVEYQYQLLGIYDTWSLGFRESNVLLKKIPPGDYTFRVRARIGDNFSENIASYSFTIMRPWYISTKMLIVYLIFFVLLLAMVHGTYKRSFNKQKRLLILKKQREFAFSKLENEKVIMKLRNEKLHNELESKNREISASTMSIIKKNELLVVIKNDITKVKEISQLNRVIRFIDKNLVDGRDWEMFQEVFNNSDSDFLKKIKSLHPALSASELRFCAYLRLNLSSKEIAPLLNISLKSVEIKRYRLRKKIGLSSKENIIDYILKI